MPKIWAVYRTGGVYTPEYVERLAISVLEHSGHPLWVLTNDADMAEYRYSSRVMLHDWPGWWSKIELFRVADHGTNLYFDLDTVITGDFGPVIEAARQLRSDDFMMLRDFTVPHEFGSGMMAWRGDHSHIYDKFRGDADRYMVEYQARPKWGDQDFIRDAARCGRQFIKAFQDESPRMVGSYKKGPYNVPIICYHGKPKPHETGWKAQP